MNVTSSDTIVTLEVSMSFNIDLMASRCWFTEMCLYLDLLKPKGRNYPCITLKQVNL